MLSVIAPGNSGCDTLALTGAPAGAHTGAPCHACCVQPQRRFLNDDPCLQTVPDPYEYDQETHRTTEQQHFYESEYNECNLDSVLIHSFKHLLKMYSMHVNSGDMSSDMLGGANDTSPLILAGGLQQYLIKNMKKHKETTEQPRRGAGSDHTTFHDLSDNMQLEIYSYLNAKELCVASMVCRHWYCIASDNILWRQRLQRDITSWDVISHVTNPQMYKECQSEWTDKEIYLRCSPEVNKLVRQSNMNFHHLSNILRTFWPKKTPRVAMFGPGLESGTNQIARKILEDKSGTFKTTGMFPGQFEGMGSGFKMKMSGCAFHLVTLYTSSRQERESRPRNQRLQHSRLLAQNAHQRDANAAPIPQGAAAVADDDDDELYEVRKPIKDLCQTLDAFIFVVDASQDVETICSARLELRAMVNDLWVKANVPVSVLACTPDGSSCRMSCLDITTHLRLPKLTRPWQVRSCTVDSMHGVTDAIGWVVEQAQRTQ